ncbi:class I SAM-dependent methyltransferase [Pseudomonas guariconensis]|uniref:class I SAM-dependent methyltransferase n=1 Tax=Pseudomonas guariconensis TaxID=1288410 RepID=UPI00366D6DE1
MHSTKNELLNEVADYYSEKLRVHGETPQGVDWNGPESQELRFEQLFQVIGEAEAFSVNDLGCGYGALYDSLQKYYKDFLYVGVDISQAMVEAARDRYRDFPRARFVLAAAPDQVADFSIASGIFNVRQGRSDDEWLGYVKDTLDTLDRFSRSGFAFNCLTSYSDAHKMRDYLYYANPGVLFDLCKTRYSRNVALLHDYDLYEFTILVRKKDHEKSGDFWLR